MKLIKKLMLALSVLLVVGMLAACSDGAGDDDKKSDTWTIMYNGTVYADDLDYEDIQSGIQYMNLETPDDYSINESTKTVTLTDAGYAKVEAFEEAMEGEEYSIVYDGEEIMTLPAYVVASMGEFLEVDTDYTINESTKTITLTDEGYEKASVLFDEA